MPNADGTYTCDHEGCDCRVADDDSHPKDAEGRIYCCDGCRDGRGCDHEGCECSGK